MSAPLTQVDYRDAVDALLASDRITPTERLLANAFLSMTNGPDARAGGLTRRALRQPIDISADDSTALRISPTEHGVRLQLGEAVAEFSSDTAVLLLEITVRGHYERMLREAPFYSRLESKP